MTAIPNSEASFPKLGRAAVDGLALFHERLHPAEHALPAFTVIGRVLHVAGKSAVRDLYHGPGADFLRTAVPQAVNAVRLQFPADDRVLGMTGVIRFPGMHQQTGR